MPLPKTASIAARATEVYSEVCKLVMQRMFDEPTENRDPKPVAEAEPVPDELYLLFPYLRQLLTCCACAGLIEDAMISLTCGHCYCFQCQYRNPLLKIQCRQCKERNCLVVEPQIRLVVKCYRELCYALTKSINNKKKTEAYEDKEQTKESVDLIAEILREVKEGVKVSRSVLVVRPPERYLNVRNIATPKKEEAAPISTSVSPLVQPRSHKKRQKEPTGVQSGTRKKIRLANQIVKKRRLHFPALRRQQVSNLHQREHLKQHRRKEKDKHDSDDEIEEEDKGIVDKEETTIARNVTDNSHILEVDVAGLCETPPLRRTSHLIWMQIPNKHLPPLPRCSPYLIPVRRTHSTARLRVPLAGRLYWKRLRFRPSRRRRRRALPISSPPSLVSKRRLSDVDKSGSKKSKLSLNKSAKGSTTPQPFKSHKLSSTPHVRPKMVKLISALPQTPTPSASNMPAFVFTPKQTKSAPSTPTTCNLSSEELKELKLKPRFRCRCGTNPGVMFLHMICAKKKCPCFLNQIPCVRCKCRGCFNPFNKLPLRDFDTAGPGEKSGSEVETLPDQ